MSVETKSLVKKFGVELEMILAFHEDRLIPVLINRGLTRQHIVKKLSNNDRYDIGVKKIPVYAHSKSRPSHRGWALRQDPNDVSDWRHTGSGRSTDFRAGVAGGYRTYWAEPLEIVRDILMQEGLRVDVELSTHPQDPIYNNWKVSNDFTLVPLSQAQMLHQFNDRISSNERDEWDTTGVEVVTPPMPADDPSSFQNIEKYLTALRGHSNSNHGICTSKYAGLHAHIGFEQSQDPEDVLKILQHLAYILVQSEPLVVKFFPPYRDGARPGNVICANETLSNRDSALKYTSNPTLQNLATTIFQSQSIPALKNIMHNRNQHKGYQVNFLNMASASVLSWNSKRTIEFRIHESTIESHAIEMWVKFCLALCRTAERQATKLTDFDGNIIDEPYSGDTEFTKYKNRRLDDRLTTTDLFDLLEFNDELRKYWQARWNRYHNDQYMEPPTPELDPFAPESSDEDDDDNDDDQDNHDKDSDDDDDSSDNDVPKGKGKSPRTPVHKQQSPATPKSKGSGQASQGRSPAMPKSGSRGKQRARATPPPAGQGKTTPSKGSATETSTRISRKPKSPSTSSSPESKIKSKSESPGPDSDQEPKPKKQKRSSGETTTTSPEPKRPRRAAS